MTTTTPWSDTPPSDDVTIHVRHKASGEELLMNFDRRDPLRYEKIQWARRNYQFGPRVLSAEETVALTAEVERLRAVAAELREKLELANRVIANPTKVAME